MQRAGVIAVIEDDPVDQRLALRALGKAPTNCVVLTFTKAEEALAYLADPAQANPDLILLDLNLPGMSGHEFLGQAKRDPALRRIPVVALTSSEAQGDVARAWDLGVCAYLVKPVSLPRLTQLLTDLVRFYFEEVTLPVASSAH